MQFGARDIILVGFDASISSGLHWHGAHLDGLGNPHEGTVEYWRQCLDDAAMDLDRIGCRIINCSQSSALRAYPKMDLAAAFEHLKKSKAQ
ncbi:hypothetical protein DEM27_00135 [Metarhizobium album]|uniref:Uncharacterized protein n=1 Tax=Metarhizobium album TaxID=2182425 RepID=A0A2U2DWG9_9HYPH|nr:hypothetical protein DEM27_00135 [Rhizobium album]